ncbi:SpoIIE family protein phosphatase [Dyella psychrodurans]|uniref:SpoIIE family protein phosphatase n=1 Tax=Dyella psychrodurans TaxID=1927960 RepID=UPI001F21BEDF|nr:SpoIIE family protein phosphatase [Dyella psychrodurans]
MLSVGGILLFQLVGHQILAQTHRESEALASDASNRIQERLDMVTNTDQVLAAIIGPRPVDAEPLLRDAISHNPDLSGLASAFVPGSAAALASGQSPFVSRTDDGSLTHRDLLKDPTPYWNASWFQAGLSCMNGCWQKPFYSQSRRRRLVSYSTAIVADGKAVGVLNADITLEWLQGILQDLDKPEGTNAFVVDQQGTFLANDTTELVGQHADAELLRTLNTHGAAAIRMLPSESNNADEPIWIYRAPIKGTNWQLGLTVPEAKIYAGVRHAFMATLIVGALALLILSLLMLVIIRRIITPLVVLTDRAEQVARGALDFALPATREHDEVGRLTHAFDRMRNELAMHIAELTRVAREQQRLASELEIAHQIQTALLPGPHYLDARCSNFELHAALQPARTVGGDLYTYFMLHDQRFCIMVGDVSDKGIPAALFMARAITLAKALAPRAQSPQQLLQLLNRELCRNNDGCMFVSLLCGFLDTVRGHLIMASAGHEPPVRWGREAPHLLQLETGPALGLDEEATYPAHRVRLQPGETLLMYTDGITEATNEALQLYGQERMLACLARYADTPDEDPVGGLVADVERFAAGYGQADDITVLALRWHHAGTERSASMLDITFAASMQDVFDTLERCDQTLEAAGIEDDVRDDVRLVLEELMVNMVQHGCLEQHQGNIGLHLTLADDAVLVELHHDGKPFDPLQSPPPALSGDCADAEELGGLGIHLVRAMASDLNYTHDEHGNHLQLRFVHANRPEQDHDLQPSQ